MAETITGAKSKLYIKEPIPGITESGDTLQHVTAQEIAGNRVGLDTVIHGVYKTHVPPKLIEIGSVKRLIKITAHGARKGDVLKINNGTAIGEEVAIVKVEDADTLIIATEINAAIGDEAFIMRHVTPLYDKDGNLNVNATPGPSQFVQNGIDVEVEEDTVTMANNKPMPGGMYIKKDDGNWYPVTLDTTNPYSHTPIPVAITDVTGTSNVNVDLSGSSLSVNIKHDGVSPSSIRIGDGTTLTSVTVNNELKVKDTDALAQLVDIEAKQDTQITHLSQIEAATEAVAAAVATEGGAQPATGLIVGGQNGAGFFRHLRVDNTGRLSVDVNSVPNTLATEATLSTLNGKIPSNLSVTASRLLVDGSGVTQPISATALPLPTGAATAANQTTANTSLSTIVTNTGNTNTNIVELNSNVGDVTDVAAGSDTGSFSILAFIKRGMQNWTTLLGVLPSAKGQQVKANSLSVTVASDQGALTVNQTAMTPTSSDVTVNSSAGTVTAPAGAKWCKIYASKNNTDDVVVRMGGTATTTVGTILEPARSEDFMVAGDVSHISVTGTQKIHITWGA